MIRCTRKKKWIVWDLLYEMRLTFETLMKQQSSSVSEYHGEYLKNTNCCKFTYLAIIDPLSVIDDQAHQQKPGKLNQRQNQFISMGGSQCNFFLQRAVFYDLHGTTQSERAADSYLSCIDKVTVKIGRAKKSAAAWIVAANGYIDCWAPFVNGYRWYLR